jgi:hypothetical protein
LIQINAEMHGRREYWAPMDAGMNDQPEQFQAVPVSWQGASAAYPLVRLHDATITLEKWLHFVRRYSGAAYKLAGLIAIQDCRGIVHALFSYRVDFDLHNRRRLCVANLIVAHVPGSQIDEAVAASTRSVSAQFGCHAVTIEQPFRPATTFWKCPTAETLALKVLAGNAGVNTRLH